MAAVRLIGVFRRGREGSGFGVFHTRLYLRLGPKGPILVRAQQLLVSFSQISLALLDPLSHRIT